MFEYRYSLYPIKGPRTDWYIYRYNFHKIMFYNSDVDSSDVSPCHSPPERRWRCAHQRALGRYPALQSWFLAVWTSHYSDAPGESATLGLDTSCRLLPPPSSPPRARGGIEGVSLCGPGLHSKHRSACTTPPRVFASPYDAPTPPMLNRN